jgi:SAM-dependent methyltransferase
MRIRANIVFVVILVSLQFSCRQAEESGSMQPVEDYPLLTNINDIKQVLKEKCIDTIRFKKGEVIADIGAGNGFVEAMLSVFNDSLTFYIQDIDTSVCNPRSINKVVDFYQEVKGQPFTNSFIVVNGTDSTTNLPDNTFDKIFMLRVYQYIKIPNEFMSDVRENLKDDGLLYIVNPAIEDFEYAKTLTRDYGWNASTLEKQISDIIDCGFELVRISRNYDGPEQPYVMVFKKKKPVG